MSKEGESCLITLQREDLHDPKLLDPIMGVLKRSYEAKGFWLGDEHFLEKTLPNTTYVQYLEMGETVVAADLYNGNRMLMLGVEPGLQGRDLAQLLLARSLKANSATWMTASAVREAGGMIRLLSESRFNLRLVQSLVEIESLFKVTNNFLTDDKFQGQMIEHAILERNIGGDRFLAFIHSKSVHGPEYMQFAFKHM